MNKKIQSLIKKIELLENSFGNRKSGNIYAILTSFSWFTVNYITKEYEENYPSNIILLYLSYGQLIFSLLALKYLKINLYDVSKKMFKIVALSSILNATYSMI
jgi:hypothetical protein